MDNFVLLAKDVMETQGTMQGLVLIKACADLKPINNLSRCEDPLPCRAEQTANWKELAKYGFDWERAWPVFSIRFLQPSPWLASQFFLK